MIHSANVTLLNLLAMLGRRYALQSSLLKGVLYLYTLDPFEHLLDLKYIPSCLFRIYINVLYNLLQASHVMAALQAGSQGTQACINAASTVSGIIGDLDTTIMFATAGTLNAEKEGENFSDHREYILKTAKVILFIYVLDYFGQKYNFGII